MVRSIPLAASGILEVFDRLLERLADGCAAVYGDRLADISRWLRKERELAFYGDVDFVPTEQYTGADAARAAGDARSVVAAVAREMGRLSA